ncbi:MAG: sodium:proton antiporter [Brucellaceae bacterium]|nr:sodium:proton antiporter [Brucellaceae bacterium]
MHDITLKIALIGALGMAAQWLAWRLHLPAIVLLLLAGFAAGPATGILDPVRDFGDIYRPLVSMAVAVILFEGGMTLNFREIRETSTAVRRILLFSGPIVWLLSALAAHFIGGLSWPTATILGAVFIVTGPTVVIPLLRQAQLAARPRSVLRWEAIVNDALGAIAAVIAFETFLVMTGAHEAEHLLVRVALAALLSLGGGFAMARLLVWAFVRGLVPEYLKAPLLLAAVLILFAVTNLALDEAGLLAVTVLGIALANSRIASLAELRRFKEMMTILLVSGLFIILTAALDMEAVRALDWRAAAFVVVLLVVIRPVAIFVSTVGSSLTWQERLLVAWIAPRGIVAVAVAGLFGTALADAGIADASRMIAFTFAVVVSTIVLHGFTLGPLARLLGLKSSEKKGVLIVGASHWSTELAAILHKQGFPVLVADSNWNHLRAARHASIPVFYGEVLSEEAHHRIDPKRFSTVIAATDNDAYNALVCTEFGPELGRSHVYQIGTMHEQSERQALNFTLGGRPLSKPGLTYEDLATAMFRGWAFQVTKLTESFTHEEFLANRNEEAVTLFWIRPSGGIVFASTAASGSAPDKGDTIVSFGPPRPAGQARQAEARAREQAGSGSE